MSSAIGVSAYLSYTNALANAQRIGNSLSYFITLIAMYVGAKLFGGVGLFGLPMCCAVLVQLENAGFLNLFPKRRDLYKAAS